MAVIRLMNSVFPVLTDQRRPHIRCVYPLLNINHRYTALRHMGYAAWPAPIEGGRAVRHRFGRLPRFVHRLFGCGSPLPLFQSLDAPVEVGVVPPHLACEAAHRRFDRLDALVPLAVVLLEPSVDTLAEPFHFVGQ